MARRHRGRGFVVAQHGQREHLTAWGCILAAIGKQNHVRLGGSNEGQAVPRMERDSGFQGDVSARGATKGSGCKQSCARGEQTLEETKQWRAVFVEICEAWATWTLTE